MFTIIGADGKEYGPVPVAKVREWIDGGRANLQTRARRVGESDFRALGEFQEFAAPGTAVPPPLPVVLSPASTPDPLAVANPDELADRGMRFLAVIIDRAVAMFCALPGMCVLGIAFLRAVVEASRSGNKPDISEMDAGRILLGIGLLGALTLTLLIVQIVLLSTRGQTIGKILLGIRVVRFRDGSPAGFVHGWFLRNFVPGIIQILPWIGFIFFFVDSCFIFNDHHRCIHDFIADTKVIKATKPAPRSL